MEPAVRVELTTNGLQIRCSATELRRQKRGRIMRILRGMSIERTGLISLSVFLLFPFCALQGVNLKF